MTDSTPITRTAISEEPATSTATSAAAAAAAIDLEQTTDWNDDDVVFQYVDPVNPNLTCCIFTTPCGHTFCRACLTRALTVTSICPIDRQSITLADLRIADPIVQHLVNELRVYCPNQSLGCKRILSRQEVNSHMRSDCVHLSVNCPHTGCSERGTPSAMETHGMECMYRVQICTDCQEKVSLVEMESHREHCTMTTTQVCCPFCYAELPLHHLDAHTEECMDRPVQCRHRDIGCRWEGTRRAASDHLSQCIYANIRPLIEEMRQRQDSLEIENRQLTDRVQVLEHELANLREPLGTGHPLPLAQPPPNGILDDGNPVVVYLEQQQHQLLSETDRLREQVIALTSEMDSRGDAGYRAQQTKEMLQQREEIQSLRSMCQALAGQLRLLMTSTNPTRSAELLRGSSGSGNKGSKANLRMNRPDVSRQETKL
ncbi:hypothetical protein BDF22DRAFT_675853 [Syncephalis plumigaleata]|nr:hypothetical protein BDF22DRAFT_675853 [Syncephalis plumigaleata]